MAGSGLTYTIQVEATLPALGTLSTVLKDVTLDFDLAALEYSTEEILKGLADGDLTVPVGPLESLLPYDLGSGFAITGWDIRTFSGRGTTTDEIGTTTDFSFNYLSGPDAIEFTFNPIVQNCFFLACTFSSQAAELDGSVILNNAIALPYQAPNLAFTVTTQPQLATANKTDTRTESRVSLPPSENKSAFPPKEILYQNRAVPQSDTVVPGAALPEPMDSPTGETAKQWLAATDTVPALADAQNSQDIPEPSVILGGLAAGLGLRLRRQQTASE